MNVELSQNVKLIICLHKLSSKAAYRLFEFDITGRILSVKYYSVYPQNKTWIVFQSGELESTVPTISSLERYFLRPLGSPFEDVTYLEYFEQNMVTPLSPRSLSGKRIWMDEAPGAKQCHVYKRRDINVA